jgi:hypothetical protein
VQTDGIMLARARREATHALWDAAIRRQAA